MRRARTAPWLQSIKVAGTLVVVAGTVALLAHGVVVVPRLLVKPSGNHQELRRAPDEPVQSPESPRTRLVRARPVRA